MNLPAFLNQVDGLISSSDSSKLLSFIHDYARTLPENQREAFLSRLQSFVTGKQMPETGIMSVTDDVQQCMKRLKDIRKDDHLCLESEYNEDYDDWYDSTDDEIFFEDPHHILRTIDQAYDLVHTCLDLAEYQDGYALSLILSKVSVKVTGDYHSGSMNLSDLNMYNLIDNNRYYRLPVEAAYLAYMSSVPSRRAENMCHILDNLDWYHFSLESMMQTGDHDLPDFDTFLPSWIETLSSYDNQSAEKLLREAVSMAALDQQLYYAEKFSDRHPELYLNILETHLTDKSNMKTMMNAGIRALDDVPVKYAIRSNIALLMAEYAVLQGDEKVREKACLEAFRSRCSLENYLRVRLECNEGNHYRQECRSIYESEHQTANHTYYRTVLTCIMDPLTENSLGDKEYDELLFFDERFTRLLDLTQPKHSKPFPRQETALLLLLVQDYEILPKGMRSMLKIAGSESGIQEKTYFQGATGEHTVSDDHLFESLFFRWKNEVHLSNEIRNEIMQKTGQLIEYYVNRIMLEKRRDDYEECAAFLAAFGEAEEFFGKENAKKDLLESWRSAYPRRSAFTGPLKSYL